MTKVVDPATGMAALDKGSYWRVTKDFVKYEGQNIYRLHLVGSSQKKVKRLKWYGKLYTKTVTEHREVFVCPIWNKDNGGPYESGYAPILTPRILRNASFRALREYEEETEKQRRLASIEDHSEQLLGNYPPKHLN